MYKNYKKSKKNKKIFRKLEQKNWYSEKQKENENNKLENTDRNKYELSKT